MKRDLYSGFAAAVALVPAVQAAAAVWGATVDVSQAVGVTFVVTTGAIVGAGDFGATLEESVDGVTWGRSRLHGSSGRTCPRPWRRMPLTSWVTTAS